MILRSNLNQDGDRSEMKKLYIMLLLICICLTMTSGAVAVKNVVAQQRYPWNGFVDVAVTMECSVDDLSNVLCIFAATNTTTGAAVPIISISRNGVDIGAETTWTRRFIWNAVADVGAVKIPEVALTVDASVAIQLWENGPYWAECNLGATKPEEYGYYFWWGDTVGYKRDANHDGWVSVKDGTGFSFSSGNCPTYGKDNSALQSAGYIDSTGNLVAAHDAATTHLGALWRMPTDAEFSALINNCTTMWITTNGVSGRLITGRGTYASKSIFLPAAGYGYGSGLDNAGSYGYYWSSTPNSDYSSYAWYLDFTSGYFSRYRLSRYLGQSVRPVRGFAK